jgi:ABC-type branched-subunit amino acid transport system substrate-binding protein
MAQRNVLRAAAVAATVLIAAAACSSGGDDGGDDGGSAGKIQVYGTDGNIGNALGEDFKEKGSLEGMKGTTPLTKLGDDFQAKLKKVDPKLKDVNYSGEAYDAVVITSLAAEYARSAVGSEVAPYINGVTAGGEKCTDYASCVALVKQGKDIDYDGVTGPLAFTQAGEPSRASFGVLEFGNDNKLDDSKTEYVIAGDEADASKQAPPAAKPASTPPKGAPVKVGNLLPLTGDLAFLGPPMVAGTTLAVQEINAAGGSLGQPVQNLPGDSGDASTDLANQTVDKHIQQRVTMIIGAAASGVSLKVIDKITGAGIIQFSPANTSDTLTTYKDKDLYFRTAPPDVLQARALADLITKDGGENVYILARNDDYGKGLMENTEKNLKEGGIKVETKLYDPKATEFASEVDAMKNSGATSIVVIGFDESKTILRTMNEKGVGPAS